MSDDLPGFSEAAVLGLKYVNDLLAQGQRRAAEEFLATLTDAERGEIERLRAWLVANQHGPS